MIKSMTGFGRGNAVLNGRDITVEIKAVNHRYYELTCKLPRSMNYCEERLKTLLNGRITRGKTELSVQIQSVGEVSEQIAVNKDIVRQYIEALRDIKDELGLLDDLTLSNVMRIPDAFTVVKAETDEEQLWEDLKTVTEQALSNFITMRENEGNRMKADLLSRLSTIEKWVDIVDERSPKIVEDYRKRLYDRMTEVLQGKEIDESRILLEAGIFADKTAVSEETVRLRSHIAQFREMLESGEPVGRKLDFLVQEMNRETNTIGSKVQDIEVTKIVVDQKSEIEKIREQIQNIE